MKQKRTLILSVALVLVLVGAYLLYNNLSKDTATDQLVVLGGQQETQAQQQTEAASGQQQTQATEATQSTENTEAIQSTQATESTEALENPAPDFTVYDAAGNSARLQDFVGKPIVLNFWASWCAPCRSEMPEFQEVFNELGQEVTFLMVNAGDETAQDVKSFLQQTGYTFPIYYDTANSAAIAYGLSAYPTTFFINARGEVVTYAVGAIDKATLLKGISYIHPQA